jgi:hypothetical protein
MDAEGRVRYFHPGTPDGASFMSLYSDTSSTFPRFGSIFDALRDKLPVSENGECVSIVQEGARLVHHPSRSYERPNLKLIQAGLGGSASISGHTSA